MFKKYRNNKFVKNVLVLVSASAIAQLLSLLLLPILTRLYSPEDFNILAIFASTIAVLTSFSTLKLDVAIPLAKGKKMAANLFVLSVFSSLVITIIIFIILTILYFCFDIKSIVGGYYFICLVSIAVFSTSTFTVLQSWAVRQHKFKDLGKVKVIQSLSGLGVQLIFGLINLNHYGLLLGQWLNSSSGIIRLYQVGVNKELTSFRNISVKRLSLTFKRYLRFPKYTTFEALANTSGIQIPVILIATVSIGAEAGFLLLASKLLQAPLRVISQSISQVFISNAAIKYQKGELGKYTQNIVLKCALLVTIPLALLALYANEIVLFIFGSEWQRVGDIIKLILPWVWLQFLVSPVSLSLAVCNKQNIALLTQIFGLLIRIGAVLTGGLFYKNNLIEIYAFSGFIFYFVYLFIVAWVVRFPILRR